MASASIPKRGIDLQAHPLGNTTSLILAIRLRQPATTSKPHKYPQQRTAKLRASSANSHSLLEADVFGVLSLPELDVHRLAHKTCNLLLERKNLASLTFKGL